MTLEGLYEYQATFEIDGVESDVVAEDKAWEHMMGLTADV